MSVYVNLKCRSCGKSFTGGYTQSYAGVGEPLLTCPKCQTSNSHASRATEWQLMSSARQIWLVISLSWSTLFYFGGGGAIVATLLLAKDVITTQPAWIALVAASLVIGFGRLFLYFRRTIRASNARMADSAYRQKLRRHGIA